MGQKTAILAVAVIIFTVILTFILILSRVHGGSKKSENVNTTPTPIVTENLVSVTDIVNNPMVYNGYSLGIDSEITSWATNKSFFFSGKAVSTFGGGPRRRLLVIAKEPFQLPQDPNDGKLGLGEIANVSVKGTVQVLNKAQLQSALGINLDTTNQTSTSSSTLYDSTLRNWTVGPVLMLDTLVVDSKSK